MTSNSNSPIDSPSSPNTWTGFLSFSPPSYLSKSLYNAPLFSVCPPEAPSFSICPSPSPISLTHTTTSHYDSFPPLASRYFSSYLCDSSCSGTSPDVSSFLSSFCYCPPLPALKTSYLLFSFSPDFPTFIPIIPGSSGIFHLPNDLWRHLCENYFAPSDILHLSQVSRYFRTLLYPFRCLSYNHATSHGIPAHVSEVKIPTTFTAHPHWIHLVSLSMRHVEGAPWGLHLLAHVAPCLTNVDISYTRTSDRDVAAFLRSRKVPMASMVCTGCVLIEGYGFSASEKPIRKVQMDLTSVNSSVVHELILTKKVWWLDIRSTPWIELDQAKKLKRLGEMHHVLVII